MPEYTFQIVIILIRGLDEVSLVRESHSLYSTVVIETVYHHAKPYLDEGYTLHRNNASIKYIRSVDLEVDCIS